MDRRVEIASQSAGRLLAWYYAQTSFVFLNPGSIVRVWGDRTNGGNNIISAVSEEPTWEASGGWDASHASLRFNGGATHALTIISGALATLRGAFGLLFTFQNFDNANNTNIVAWHDAANSQWVAVTTTPSAGNAFIRVERFDGSTLVGASGTIALGAGHRRVAVSFDGVRVSTWIDAVQDLNNSSLAGVGSISSTRFTMGWGGNPFSSNMRIVEMQVFRSALTAQAVAGYQASSLINWGA